MFLGMQAASKSGAVRAVGGMVSGFGSLLSIIKPFEPLLKVIGNLMNLLVGSALKELAPVLKPIIQLLLQLGPLFQLVGTVLGWLIGVVLKGIVWVIYGIAKAIAFFVDLFSWLWGAPGSAGAAVDQFFAPVLGSFAVGTPNVPQTGLYMLHAGEKVQTRADVISEYRRDMVMERVAKGVERLVYIKEDRF